MIRHGVLHDFSGGTGHSVAEDIVACADRSHPASMIAGRTAGSTSVSPSGHTCLWQKMWLHMLRG